MAENRKLPSWMKSQPKAAKTSTNILNEGDEESKGLPNLSFPGRITYCYNKNECNFICEEIIKNSRTRKSILGFDIEWKVTYVKGDYRKTSLLQLCPGDKSCYIFQLVHMDGFPSELRKLLEDTEILKVGVGIQGDMDRLNNDYGVIAGGVVDLAVKANGVIRNYENWSLNRLLQNQLHYQISKCNSVRCSDWESIPLSTSQLEYAALDAYAAILIYLKLHEKSL